MKTTSDMSYVPLAAFESVIAGPNSVPYVDRPMVRLGEHHVLREQFFRGNPQLTNMLDDPGRIGHTIDGHPMTSVQDCFARYFSRVADLCESKGAWPAGSTRGTAFRDYLRTLTAQIPAIYTVQAGAVRIDVLTMPTPVGPTECHFIALCRPLAPSAAPPFDTAAGLSPALGAPAGSRFVTLEKTVTDGIACVCEWTQQGTHENLGNVPWSTFPQFLSKVFQLLGVQAPADLQLP
jgi:hypothetical protein